MPRSVRFVLTIALAVAVVTARGASAQVACSSEYTAVMSALDEAHLSYDSEQSVASSVGNARRLKLSVSKGGLLTPINELATADEVISGATLSGVPEEATEPLVASIDAYRTCLGSAPAVPTTTITVTVRSLASEDSGEVPQLAGAGVSVLVGDVTATTNMSSIATLTVPAGVQSVAAKLGNAGGATKVDLAAGTSMQVEVVLLPSRDTAAPARLRSAEIVNGVLPRDFTALTLRVETPLGLQIEVEKLDQVEITVADIERRVLTSMFHVEGGVITIADQAAFAAFVLGHIDPFELRARVLDASGNAYNASLRFAIGRYRTSAALVVPIGVSTTNVPVRLTHQRTGFSFWATSPGTYGVGRQDQSSFASFPLLPAGTYLVECETVVDGERWYGRGGFALDSDKTYALSLFRMAPPDEEGVIEIGINSVSTPQPKLEGPGSRLLPDGTVVPVGAWTGQRVVAVDVTTTGKGGPFEFRRVDVVDWPRRLVNTPDPEIEAAEGLLIAVPEEILRSELRPVFLRALDATGREILRQVIDVVVLEEHEDALLPPASREPRNRIESQAAAAATPPEQRFRAIANLVVLVPYPETRTIELRGWRPDQIMRWDVATMLTDPKVPHSTILRPQDR